MSVLGRGRIALLKLSSAGSSIGKPCTRACSSETHVAKTNEDFPSFTTMGIHTTDFHSFIKAPNASTISSVILFGKPLTGKVFDTDVMSLLEGALTAAEYVSSNISNEDLFSEQKSELTTQLSPECFAKIKDMLSGDTRFTPSRRAMLKMDREDIFHAWFGSGDKNKGTLTIVALYFPNFSKIHNAKTSFNEIFRGKLTAAAEAKQELSRELLDEFKQTAREESGMPNVEDNRIIISNWRFIQVQSGDF